MMLGSWSRRRSSARAAGTGGTGRLAGDCQLACVMGGYVCSQGMTSTSSPRPRRGCCPQVTWGHCGGQCRQGSGSPGDRCFPILTVCRVDFSPAFWSSRRPLARMAVMVGMVAGPVTLLRNASLDSGLVVGRPTSYSLTCRAPVSVTGGAVWRSVHSRCLGCFCAWILGHFHDLLASGSHFFFQ